MKLPDCEDTPEDCFCLECEDTGEVICTKCEGDGRCHVCDEECSVCCGSGTVFCPECE